jgi:hypothetical protein
MRRVVAEPRAVLLVFLLNVSGEPIAQEVEQINTQHGIAALEAGSECIDLFDEFLMLGAVRSQAGKSSIRHQCLFRCEMAARVIRQVAKQRAGHGLRVTLFHRVMQFIKYPEEHSVLIVHG